MWSCPWRWPWTPCAKTWRQPRVFLSLLPPTLERLTVRGIPPRQVYNMTFCKVVPGGDDPEPHVQKMWRQPRVLITLLPSTLEHLTLRGIPSRQVYNMTFCMVVPGGDDPEPYVQKMWRQPRVLISLLASTLEHLTLCGIPPGQVYNLTFCKVVQCPWRWWPWTPCAKMWRQPRVYLSLLPPTLESLALRGIPSR